MKNILLTGFEPFGGETINPSWEVVKTLDGLELAGAKVVARQLPCVFGAALSALHAAIDETQPWLILSVGQAGGRAEINIERIAINVDDASIADNLGQKPVDQPIVANGPAAYFARLPIKAVLQALRQAGIPAIISQSAGTYVCNHVMYGLLHRLQQTNSPAKAGFIHIPYLPEQVTSRPGTPSMAASLVATALKLALSVALSADCDQKLAAGATH